MPPRATAKREKPKRSTELTNELTNEDSPEAFATPGESEQSPQRRQCPLVYDVVSIIAQYADGQSVVLTSRSGGPNSSLAMMPLPLPFSNKSEPSSRLTMMRVCTTWFVGVCHCFPGEILKNEWWPLVAWQERESHHLRAASNITDADLVHLDLSFNYNITNAGLVHLKELKYLQHLNLEDCFKITDAGLECLTEIKGLLHLNLNRCRNVTEAGLLQQLKEWKELRHLHLGGGMLSDRGLECLKKFKGLHTLGLKFSHNFTDAGLVHLSELKDLRVLNLNNCWTISNVGLVHLKELKHLQHLDLSFNITGAGLEHLKELKDLQHLSLEGCKNISDAALATWGCIRGLALRKELANKTRAI